LAGCHDGSLDKEQAREFIRAKEQAKKWIVALPSGKATNIWDIKFQGGEAQAKKYFRKKSAAVRKPRGIALLNPFEELIESAGDISGLFD
jgi:hypothetical protein